MGFVYKKEIYTQVFGNLRIQVLSETLVRLELKGPQGFEDRKTFHIVNRDDWPGDIISRKEKDQQVMLEGSKFIIIVNKDARSLSDVSITDKNGKVLWKFSKLSGNKVYLPRANEEVYAFEIADTPRIVPPVWGFRPQPADNMVNRETNGWDLNNDAPDMYIFLPGNDHRRLRKDFVHLTGRTEMLPLSALGAWDSRYYKYTQETALAQVDGYHSRKLPLDVLVVDTDWRDSSTGMGYKINTELFPDMEDFFRVCHQKKVDVIFNDHPEPTRRNDKDNNVLVPEEVEYRFSNLTRLLEMGLDAWWFDRNWSKTVIPPEGFTHEVMGMAVYTDAFKAVYPNRRLFIMSNVDGITNGTRMGPSNIAAHRYAVQWTGDTIGGQETIIQEIINTVERGETCALPYVSTDLGAHQTLSKDINDREYIRWIQMGALSPIFRPHVMLNDTGRMPWLRGEEVTNLYREYLNLRYRLLPVFYQLARENYDTGMPLVRAMSFYAPDCQDANRYDQYMLGDNILVAPAIEGNENNGEYSRERTVFIPEGEWINTIDGEIVIGPKTITVSCKIHKIPIFIRRGAVIPLADEMLTVKDKDWSHLTLELFPSRVQSCNTILYEDDTVSTDYEKVLYRTSLLKTGFENNNQGFLLIEAAQGDFNGERACRSREWTVRIHGQEALGPMKKVLLNGKPLEFEVIEKDPEAIPLNNKGGAVDGPVYVVKFKAPVYESQKLVFKF